MKAASSMVAGRSRGDGFQIWRRRGDGAVKPMEGDGRRSGLRLAADDG
nr:hypothetical protein Iba_chr02dCG1440 [Ipomoea batatas]